MEKVTISQLKNRLSAYLRKVRAGATILVLDRDEPVARLERVGVTGPAGDRLASLERAGLVRRARRRVALERLRQEAPRVTRSVVAALIEERREGR